uniref:Peptidase S1 domain-containing protein n=1 Tax=Glossina austeni TaxID=7395 RepID=A0A1A9URB4_GLOAU
MESLIFIIEMENYARPSANHITMAKIEGNELEQPTDLDKWIVWIGWDDGRHRQQINGVILSEKIVLTSYAPDLMNAPKSIGKIVYGETKMPDICRKENVINWSKSMNYIADVLSPNSTDIQLALIKLNERIKLKSPDVEAIEIPDRQPDENSDCVVIGKGTILEDYIVKIKATIVHKSICKEKFPELDENNSVCIVTQSDMTDGPHCRHYQTGSPLICDGLFAGLVNWQPRCTSNITICTNVCALQQWIKKSVKIINAFSLYSPYAKYVVWYGRRRSGVIKQNGFGIIITENIILTHHVEYVNDAEVRGVRVAVYGYPYTVNDKSNVVYVGWTNYTNYSNNLKPPRYEPQLGLIRLNEDINLDDEFATTIPIPVGGRNLRKCVVLFYKYDVIYEAPVKVIPKKECKRMLPDLYEDSICINWKDVDKGFNHCKNLMGGAPLICGDELAGIVSEQKPCDYLKPRPCVDVFKFRKWILSNLKPDIWPRIYKIRKNGKTSYAQPQQQEISAEYR